MGLGYGEYLANHRDVFSAKKSGFTLVEILFAVIIFSALLFGISILTSGSGHFMKLSANSFQAFHLGSKVLEDVVEEGRINGDILSQLNQFPELSALDPVLESQSVYFRYLKDRKPAWGVILPDEGGIFPCDGDLFPTLKSFRAGISASRNGATDQSEFEKHLCTVEVLVEWEEKDGMKRQFVLPFFAPCPWGPAATESALILTDEVLKVKIRETLFPDLSNRSFDQAVAETGADPVIAFHVGKLAVYTNALTASMTNMTNDLKVMDKRRSLMVGVPSPDLVNLQIKMARMMEGGASLVFYMLAELTASIRELEKSADSRSFSKIPEGVYKSCLGAFQSKVKDISQWLKASKDAYEWLLQPGFKLLLTGREKELVRFKILEAYRVLTALNFLPKSKYRDFIKSETTIWEGKNPFLHRLYLNEIKICDDISRLRTCFPNLSATVSAYEKQIKICADMVPKLIAKYPSGF